MKLALFSITLCLFANVSFAADWTPVFKAWETHAEDSDILRSVTYNPNVSWDDLHGWTTAGRPNPDSNDLVLIKKFDTSQLLHIPEPYRSDIILIEYESVYDTHIGNMKDTIYLQNATLYGLPITKIVDYGAEGEEMHTTVYFDKMSNAQYRNLKKIKLKYRNDDWCDGGHQAEFRKDKYNQVTLFFSQGC